MFKILIHFLNCFVEEIDSKPEVSSGKMTFPKDYWPVKTPEETETLNEV